MLEYMLFILLGVINLYGFLIRHIIKIRKHTEKVEAVIEEVVNGTLIHNGVRRYSTICSYTYKGREYKSRVENNTYKDELEIGSKIYIYINPNEPEQTYIENKRISAINYLGGVVAVIFIALGIFFIIDEGIVSTNNYDGNNKVDYNYNVEEKVEDSSVDESEPMNEESLNSLKDELNNEIKEAKEDISNTDNYVKLYDYDYNKIINSELGSDTRTIFVEADSAYTDKCVMMTHIIGMILYLPKEFKLVKESEDNYIFKNSVTKSKLNIIYRKHKKDISSSIEQMNTHVNNYRILGSVKERNFYNNNYFEICKARNIQGEYLDIACSVNKKHMVYIEYNHKQGTENIFEDFIMSVKY